MADFTNYLTVLEQTSDQFKVRIESGSTLPLIQAILKLSKDLRYRPLLPAYLETNENPRRPPYQPDSLAFFFSRKPYQSLAKIRPLLTEQQRHLIFFTEGLA